MKNEEKQNWDRELDLRNYRQLGQKSQNQRRNKENDPQIKQVKLLQKCLGSISLLGRGQELVSLAFTSKYRRKRPPKSSSSIFANPSKTKLYRETRTEIVFKGLFQQHKWFDIITKSCFAVIYPLPISVIQSP